MSKLDARLRYFRVVYTHFPNQDSWEAQVLGKVNGRTVRTVRDAASSIHGARALILEGLTEALGDRLVILLEETARQGRRRA